MDDIEVTTSEGGGIWIQAKHSLDLATTEASPLATAVDQCVRQFRDGRSGGVSGAPTPLDPLTDRLVISTSSLSSSLVRVDLPRVLERIRSLPGDRLDAAPANAKERRALGVLLRHVRRLWKNHLGSAPSDGDLRPFFQVFRLWILDVEPGEPGEREALNLLKTTILANPPDAKLAWALFDEKALDIASSSCGANRFQLQQLLLDANLRVQAVRSFRKDVQTLEAHSKQTGFLLERHTSLTIGDRRVTIRRPVEDAVRAAAGGPLLIVGEPGAGKTAVLQAIYRSLEGSGARVVLLSAGQLAEATAVALRAELSLENGLTDVLKNWPGTEPGYLLIDALDAARGEPGERTLRDLIRLTIAEVANGWRVIASVREFDLRYSDELQRLFRGLPPTEFVNPEFDSLRHVYVSRLSDGELSQLETEAPELHALLQGAPPDLREILRVPFNLEIASDLLSVGDSTESFRTIGTQVELLDLYWTQRVVGSDVLGDAREAVLSAISEEMIRTRRLVAPRTCVQDPKFSTALNYLLSYNVLCEWHESPDGAPNRYQIAYSHLILFNYAVARLRFRCGPDALLRTLAEDTDAALVILPSIVLHFRHLWRRNRSGFWTQVFRIVNEVRIPEIHKIIGPAVAAETTRNLNDLQPVLAGLDSVAEADRRTAETVLRHVFGAVVARLPDNTHVVGTRAGPWCEVISRLSDRMAGSVPTTLDWLLNRICEYSNQLTPPQRDQVGRAARNLLQYHWSQASEDALLVRRALQAVCKTFSSHPLESSRLLRKGIDPQHMKLCDSKELASIPDNLLEIAKADPSFIVEVYGALFAHEETSTDPKPMGSSRILRLLSNRKQDHEGILHQLAAVYPDFLKQHLLDATSALVRVFEAYVAQEDSKWSRMGFGDEVFEAFFDFDGQRATLREGHSCMWASSRGHREDYPMMMLHAWEAEIRSRLGSQGGFEGVAEVVRVVVRENRTPVLWHRLLRIACAFPETFGILVRPLAWAVPVLVCDDTEEVVPAYLCSVFPHLRNEDRVRVEHAILSLQNAAATFKHCRVEEIVEIGDRLLRAIPTEYLVTVTGRERARALSEPEPVRALKAASGERSHEPAIVCIERSFGRTPSAVGGTESAAVRRRKELSAAILDAVGAIGNARVTLGHVCAMVPQLEELVGCMKCGVESEIDREGLDDGWRALAAGCSRLSVCEDLSSNADALSFVVTSLIQCSLCRIPEPGVDDLARFDDVPVLSGDPRALAAAGLMHICAMTGAVNGEAVAAIRRLAKDPVPAVRLMIAQYLPKLSNRCGDLMVEMLDRYADEEMSDRILSGIVDGFCGIANAAHSRKLTSLAIRVFNRIKGGLTASRVLGSCASALAQVFAFEGEAECREVIGEMLDDLPRFREAALSIPGALRDALTVGPVEASDSRAGTVRARGFLIIGDCLEVCRSILVDAEVRLAGIPSAVDSKTIAAGVSAALEVAETIATEVHIASGAFGANGDCRDSDPVLAEVSNRFYRESVPVLRGLAEIGSPGAAHELLQTLEHLIPACPRDLFLLIGLAIKHAQEGAYEFESVASDLMARVVRRYLSKYRSILFEEAECRKALSEILNVFVRAGWPEAIKLAYRLEEIFR